MQKAVVAFDSCVLSVGIPGARRLFSLSTQAFSQTESGGSLGKPRRFLVAAVSHAWLQKQGGACPAVGVTLVQVGRRGGGG